MTTTARGVSTTVLVADDDPRTQSALRIDLVSGGYQVLMAQDGAAALRAAVDCKPDVVVLDLDLPDLDGIEVIAGLRGWSTVPMVVLSAHTPPAR